MRFYSKKFKEPLTTANKYPCIVFVKDGWDDDGFRISFELTYYSSPDTGISIGTIKILDRNTKNTILADTFDYLEENQCSLGQNLEYYEHLKRNLPDQYEWVLERLNDIVLFKRIAKEFKFVSGFNAALLRFTSAQRAFAEGWALLKENTRKVHNKLHFTYQTQLQEADGPHKATFNFIQHEALPYRINVLIGKNGTGKTQYLGRMINDVSGAKKNIDFNFQPFIPQFNKFIAISYSLFDDFPKPPDTTVFNYKYIGLRSENESIISDESLKWKLQEALHKVIEEGRRNEWFDILNQIIPLSSLNMNKGADLTELWVRQLEFEKEKRLSSGQSILFFILTELIAHITEESLIIFDEPETHLHPSAIAQLIKSFSKILSTYQSFAIISTHSPIIIQDIPSNYINIFDRIDNTPIVRKLPLESFGENISVLTDSVFQTVDVKELYKSVFERLIELDKTEDEINLLFKNKLSFNAMLYLNSLFQQNNNEKS